MREFVTLEKVAEDHVLVRTTRGELYRMDASHGEGRAVGDLMLVAYEPADKVANDGAFDVSPKRVESASTRVAMNGYSDKRGL